MWHSSGYLSSIYLSICHSPSIYPSIHSSIHPFIHPSIHPSIYLPIFYLFICLPASPSVVLVYIYINMCVCVCVCAIYFILYYIGNTLPFRYLHCILIVCGGGGEQLVSFSENQKKHTHILSGNM
jgi:hypothetical protein